MAEQKRDPVLVRSTIHLRGLPLGSLVHVDPSEAWMRRALRSKALVRVRVKRDDGSAVAGSSDER